MWTTSRGDPEYSGQRKRKRTFPISGIFGITWIAPNLVLLYSCRFSLYSAHSWLVLTMKPLTAKWRQWAKTMTSNGTDCTVTREILTAVARDQRCSDVVAGISVFFYKIAFVFFFVFFFSLLYNKSLKVIP